MTRSTPPTAPMRWRTSASWRCGWARSSRTRIERAALVVAARETVKSLGGALERTLAALDPYLVDLRMDRPQSHA